MYDTLKQAINSIQLMDDSDWGIVLPMFKYREIKKRGYLLKEGQICKNIDFIVEGCARIYANYDGKDVTCQFFFENGFLNEISSFVTQTPAVFSIGAIENCKLLSISKIDIDKLYEHNMNTIKLGRKIMEQVAIFAINRNVEINTLTAKDRYLRLIEERPKVMSRVPLHMIASYIGITPEALSRIRKEITTDM